MCHIVLIDSDDVDAAYWLLKYQLETASNLFSVDQLNEVISKRLGRSFRPPLANNSTTRKFVSYLFLSP